MKLYCIDEQFGIDELRLVEKDVPKPGHGEVLVKMKAASLNYRDLLMIAGKYNPDYAKARIYTPNISRNVLIYELVVENEEAHAKFFADFNAMPEAAAFWEKWSELTDRATGTERWNVTELG